MDYIDKYENLIDSLSVTVKIDHAQVHKVVIRDLIGKRNSCAKYNKNEGVEHFDYVLRCYLCEDEFEKYVINCADITP